MSIPATDNPNDLDRYARLLAEAQAIHGATLAADAWRRLKKNRVAYFSLWLLGLIALAAVLTPLLPLQSPYKVNISKAFDGPTASPLFAETLDPLPETPAVPPASEPVAAKTPASTASADLDPRADWIAAQFGNVGRVNRWLIEARLKLFGRWSVTSICGRDELGRDVLARLFWGSLVSLKVGLDGALVSLFVGVTWGAIAGYAGGWLDNLMMRLVDILYSVPFVFIVIFMITILSAEPWKSNLETIGIDRITILFVLVGLLYWLTMARVVRGQVLSLKHEQFVDAARTIGASRKRIIFMHLVPNLLSVIIVYLTLTIPRVMLLEAFLSFLGLGVQAPEVSWGLLANQGFHVITPIKIFWWLFAFPALAIGITLFALNFLGDGLRDALDPRLKNK